MASLTLYVDNFQTSPYVLPCFPFDFKTAYNDRAYSGYTALSQHAPSAQPNDYFWALTIKGKVSYNKTVDDTVEPITLFEAGDLPASFLPAIQYRYSGSSLGYIQPPDDAYTVITSKPSDWDDICLKYIATRGQNGDLAYSSYTDWNTLSQYAGQQNREILRFNTPIAQKFLVKGGLNRMSFGVLNFFNFNNGYNRMWSGVGYPVSTSYIDMGIGYFGTGDMFSFRNIENDFIIVNNRLGADAVVGSPITDTSIVRVQTYPVEFVVPSGITIGGKTTTSAVSMYGTMSVSFDSYGEPVSYGIQALSKEMWDISRGGGNAAGADTIGKGGRGKQTKGNYDPSSKSITRAGSAGLLTDPTSGAGFVIWKFHAADFSSFLSKLYTETALPSMSTGLEAATTAATSAWVKPLVETLSSKIGFTDTDNIVFVKTSPVDFPSTGFQTIGKLSVGTLGAKNVTAAVVTSYISAPSDITGKTIGSKSEWFTDVEPYASASIFFPLAGSIAIPPSYIDSANGEEATAKIKRSYNLLTEGCCYDLFIEKGGNWIHLSKSGQCAKSADCVIPGRDISQTVGSLGSLAATGIATLATGGTTAPALVTTAAGAAVSAVHDATNLSVSNLPPTSSDSPYDDTVNGGLRDIVLYRPKAVRYSKDESVSGGGRATTMGTFSYAYVSTLSTVGDGSYVSVYDVQLPMAGGMTKAEHDKIVALLQKGVYI